MTPADLQALPHKKPDARIAYGTDSSQYGELRLPRTPGRHPVVVLIHGGCWKAAYATSSDLAPMGDALRDSGFASWNIEYRRLGQPGGGWPGTFLDVGRAIDHLRELAKPYSLDLDRVVVVGHSAGGHLAQWSAARSRLPKESPLHAANPLPVRGAINMAGTIDLAQNIEHMHTACHDSVLTQLLGGRLDKFPERYRQGSPAKLIPIGVKQVLVWDQYDDFVPPELAETYRKTAAAAGDSVDYVVVPNIGHFELGSPFSPSWPHVVSAIRRLAGSR